MKAEKEAEKAPGINSKNTNSNLIWGTKAGTWGLPSAKAKGEESANQHLQKNIQ